MLLGLSWACGDDEGSNGSGGDPNDAGAGGEETGGSAGASGTGGASGASGTAGTGQGGRGGSSGSQGTGGAGNSAGSSSGGEGGTFGGEGGGGAGGAGGAGTSGGGIGGGTGGVGDCIEACATFLTTNCTTAAADFCEAAEQSCQERYDDNPDCVTELGSMDACAALQPASNFVCPLGTMPDEVRPYRLSEDACVSNASALDDCLN